MNHYNRHHLFLCLIIRFTRKPAGRTVPRTRQGEGADSFKWSTTANATWKHFSWMGRNKTQMQSYLTEPVLHIHSQLCNEPQDNFTGLHQAQLPAGFHRGALNNQNLQERDPVFSLLMKRFILRYRNSRSDELSKSVTPALTA